ncbi:MAG: hypothetical protein HY784_01245 [Chloroflexi bacterium]|nr:hypothetical protein [Chloroflexota bacterium]
MQRVNFTLNDNTLKLLELLAAKYYNGNKSQTVRAALESLAVHTRHEGWLITGYTPVMVDGQTNCHTCGDLHQKGDVLYRPVFERGEGPGALPRIPLEIWMDCPNCVEQAIA